MLGVPWRSFNTSPIVLLNETMVECVDSQSSKVENQAKPSISSKIWRKCGLMGERVGRTNSLRDPPRETPRRRERAENPQRTGRSRKLTGSFRQFEGRKKGSPLRRELPWFWSCGKSKSDNRKNGFPCSCRARPKPYSFSRKIFYDRRYAKPTHDRTTGE